MSRAALAGLGIAAGLLTAALALEIAAPTGAGPEVAPARAARGAPGHGEAAAPDLAGRRDGWARIVLARPLFRRDRRPPPGAAARLAAGPPRLSGIVISGDGRRAIFTGANGKPLALGEGARLGAFQVGAITAGRVILVGPKGTLVLFPAFRHAAAGAGPRAVATLAPALAPALAATLAAAQPLPSFRAAVSP